MKVPAEKARDTEDGFLVYGEAFKGTFLDYGERCPVCSGGQAQIENIKTKAKLPTSAYDVTIDRFKWDAYGVDTSKQRKFVLGWMNHYKRVRSEGLGLYIWSEMKGSGKTYLASAICNSLIQTFKTRPLFADSSALISYNEDGRIGELEEAELLVLDDLGRKAPNNYYEDLLFQIMDKRMQNKRPTIITSNLRTGKLPYDQRAVDRIATMSPEVHLPEVSIRLEKSRKSRKELFVELDMVDGPEQMAI